MENNEKNTMVVLRTDGTHDIVQLNAGLLDTIHQLVGGFFEIVRTDDPCTGFRKVLGGDADKIVMLVNDEGLLLGLDWNLLASYTVGYKHPICGNVAYMMEGFNEDGEPDLLPLTEEQSTAISIILSACGSRRVTK